MLKLQSNPMLNRDQLEIAGTKVPTCTASIRPCRMGIQLKICKALEIQIRRTAGHLGLWCLSSKNIDMKYTDFNMDSEMFKIITENNTDTILIRWLDTKEDWRLPQLKSFNFVGVSKTTSSAGDGKPLFQFHIEGSTNALRLIPSICRLAQGIFGATGWHTPGWDKPGKVCNASCKQDESSMVT